MILYFAFILFKIVYNVIVTGVALHFTYDIYKNFKKFIILKDFPSFSIAVNNSILTHSRILKVLLFIQLIEINRLNT